MNKGQRGSGDAVPSHKSQCNNVALVYHSPRSQLCTALSVPITLKADMPVFPITFIAQSQHYSPICKMLRVVILLVQLYALPAHIHEIAIATPIDFLDHTAASDASAAFNVTHNVGPERPGAFVPGRGCLNIDSGASERRKWVLERRRERESMKVGMADQRRVGRSEWAEGVDERFVER